MADWSQLPTELLISISNRLNSDLYLLRFRSVCSTWRSSILNNHHQHRQNLPSNLPLLSNSINYPNTNSISTTLSLSKRTLFLIFPPPQTQTQTLHHPWLIKINNNDNQLLNPLSRHSPFTPYFPHLLDFNDLSVVELGQEFVLDNAEFPPLLPVGYVNRLSVKKVVVLEIERCFFLLAICVSGGELAVFRCGDERWTILEMLMSFDDVCVFKGKPIAVNRTGTTFRVRVGVGMELGLDLVAEPDHVSGGSKKYLVESNGELLLVVTYINMLSIVDYYYDDDDDDDNGDVYWVMKFDIYKLDEKEKWWVKLTSLRDRILFLGDDCAFSVSASDLGFRNGNCVMFCVSDFQNGGRVFRDDDLNKFDFGMGVFDLDLQKISALQKDYSFYFDLFWPPEWIRSR